LPEKEPPKRQLAVLEYALQDMLARKMDDMVTCVECGEELVKKFAKDHKCAVSKKIEEAAKQLQEYRKAKENEIRM
jgi:CMP-N-acetylneuraminic acid synthetase